MLGKNWVKNITESPAICLSYSALHGDRRHKSTILYSQKGTEC